MFKSSSCLSSWSRCHLALQSEVASEAGFSPLHNGISWNLRHSAIEVRFLITHYYNRVPHCSVFTAKGFIEGMCVNEVRSISLKNQSRPPQIYSHSLSCTTT